MVQDKRHGAFFLLEIVDTMSTESSTLDTLESKSLHDYLVFPCILSMLVGLPYWWGVFLINLIVE